MLLVLLAWVGGVLTIISPCILPVVPFIFARQGKSFARSTLGVGPRTGRKICAVPSDD